MCAAPDSRRRVRGPIPSRFGRSSTTSPTSCSAPRTSRPPWKRGRGGGRAGSRRCRRARRLVPRCPHRPRPAPARTFRPNSRDAIGRTLVLAQRTADSLIAEARAEASPPRRGSEQRGGDDSRLHLGDGRDDARRGPRGSASFAGETERLAVASEVDSLKARRVFLESDVDHLEQFLVADRSRVRDAAAELIEITDRVPAGLGDARRPLLSASDDAPADPESLDDGDAVVAGADDSDDPDGFVDVDAKRRRSSSSPKSTIGPTTATPRPSDRDSPATTRRPPTNAAASSGSTSTTGPS